MFRVNRVVSMFVVSMFIAAGLMLVSGLSFAAESVSSVSQSSSQSLSQTPTVVSDSFIEARNLYSYGMKLYNDAGSDKDLSKAFKLFKQSAINGFPRAGYQLGLMYRDGTGIARNKNESVKWLRRAAAWGVAEARIVLDELISNKESNNKVVVSRNDINFSQQGATADDKHRIAMMLIENDDKDFDQAIPFLTDAAMAGHLKSQYQLGMLYKDGQGTEKDLVKAKKWLNQAAENGFIKARQALRDLLAKDSSEYEYTAGKSRFRFSPVTRYEADAQSGDVVAQFKLGMMYIKGDILDKNPEQALKWLRLAAQGNNTEAQLALGELLYKGFDVDRDFVESAKWFQLAATSGNAMAQYQLANMYRKGIGLPKDSKMAGVWYRKAAKQGHAKAIDNLAGL